MAKDHDCFLKKLKEFGKSLFGSRGSSKLGFFSNLIGEQPAVILDTSAIIDLEEKVRKGKIEKDFLKHNEYSRMLIPDNVYEECKVHKNVRINGYEREISPRTFKNIKEIYENESKPFFEKYTENYQEDFGFAAYTISKMLENDPNNDIELDEIGYADKEILRRALEAKDVQYRDNWEGFVPSDVVVLTSDKHVEGMLKTARDEYDFGGISIYLTK